MWQVTLSVSQLMQFLLLHFSLSANTTLDSDTVYRYFIETENQKLENRRENIWAAFLRNLTVLGCKGF